MIQAVARALALVEAVGRSADGLRLSEAADGLGLNRPTAHNLLRTLREQGYLEQARGGRYRLGAALNRLGHQRLEQGIFRRAEAAIRELHAEWPESTVTFSELVGDTICCRLRMSAPLAGTVQRPVSQTFAPYGSASGVCLQAHHAGFRDALARQQGFAESGSRDWGDRAAFDQALATAVRDGVAVIARGGSLRMAAPIGDRYALGLALTDTTAAVAGNAADRLREAARRLSEGAM